MADCTTCRHYLSDGNCDSSLEGECCEGGGFEGWEGKTIMNTNPVVQCPWCGSEMALYKGAVYPRRNGVGLTQRACYQCAKCGARSPVIHDDMKGCNEIIEAATAAAQERWQEPNRVLKITELVNISFDEYGNAKSNPEYAHDENIEFWYVETRFLGLMVLYQCEVKIDFRNGFFSIHDMSGCGVEGKYGEFMRCWFRRPTMDERINTPWEIE